MNSFYIAMGQGIVAHADLEVFTEALLSCTFITGRSTSGRRGGAFHYPARTFANVRPVLDQWLQRLHPAEITLIFATAGDAFGMGTPADDQTTLLTWVRARYPTITVNTTTAVAAGMSLSGAGFQAGNVAQHSMWDPEIAQDVTEIGAGRYETFELFDARDLMNASAGPVVQEATAGRRKRKRSWVKRRSHGCVIL